jgi:hypothetical protein
MGIFITGECSVFRVSGEQILGLRLVTGALGAALAFAARLPVRAYVFLRFDAPIDAAVKLVLFNLIRRLIVHLLATEMTARG